MKEKQRVAVRKGLLKKLKDKCSRCPKAKRQIDVLQAALDVSNYVNPRASCIIRTYHCDLSEFTGEYDSVDCILSFVHNVTFLMDACMIKPEMTR